MIISVFILDLFRFLTTPLISITQIFNFLVFKQGVPINKSVYICWLLMPCFYLPCRRNLSKIVGHDSI